MATVDLMTRARAGDGDAFRELIEPYRRELLVHCYRMLGAYQDAEDVLQETLLAAWHGFGGFEGRASLRTALAQQRPAREPAPPPPGSPAEDAIVARFVRAWEDAALTRLGNTALPHFRLPAPSDPAPERRSRCRHQAAVPVRCVSAASSAWRIRSSSALPVVGSRRSGI